MSDDEIKDLYAGWDKHDERISELEARENYHDLATKFGAFEMINQTRHIEIEGEIAELRNLIQGNAISDLNHYEVNVDRGRYNTKQLNELKEQVFNCNVQDGEIATVLHLKTDNIKEVLRDFIDLQYHVYTLSQQHGDAPKYEKLLEKLDVRSAAHTEERDITKIPTSIMRGDGKIEKLSSGSGNRFEGDRMDEQLPFGEKSHSSDTTLSGTDSKPPEPMSEKEVHINGGGIDYTTDDPKKDDNKIRNLSITYEEPREDLYFCRLCGNEITDVEHEVSKLTVEVKREDLQWLLQMSKIARKHMGRPVDKAREKRIKEEYGIE